MAAQLKPQPSHPGTFKVSKTAFAKIVANCENPPKPTQALREMIASARLATKKM